MKKFFKFIGVVFVLASFTLTGLQAQIVGYYPSAGPVGTDGQGNETYSVNGNPVIYDGNSSVTDLTLASGLAPTNLTKYGFGYAFGSTTSNYGFAPDLGSAIAANAYITFTVTPNAGYAYNLTDLDFSTQNFVSQNNGTDTRYLTLESSATGFDATDSLGTITLNPGTNSTGTLIDFSSNPAFTNLTGPVEFRLYVTDPTSAGNYESIGLSSGYFTLDGSSVLATSTPEPSTFAFLGLGFSLLIFTLRARRSIRS